MSNENKKRNTHSKMHKLDRRFNNAGNGFTFNNVHKIVLKGFKVLSINVLIQENKFYLSLIMKNIYHIIDSNKFISLIFRK